ncbi:MAG: hypothetical protein ACP5D7_12280 [Limnospira sp.]
MTVTHYKWTVDRYHRAIAAGLFDDEPIELTPSPSRRYFLVD